jgi:hypothetical protein
MRINMDDRSITIFQGCPVDTSACHGDVMALSDDGRVLYVGYSRAKCVIAYDVVKMDCTWKTDMAERVNSVSYHAGLVLVGVCASEFCVLNAENGDLLRKLTKASNYVFGHTILSGMRVRTCV